MTALLAEISLENCKKCSTYFFSLYTSSSLKILTLGPGQRLDDVESVTDDILLSFSMRNYYCLSIS